MIPGVSAAQQRQPFSQSATLVGINSTSETLNSSTFNVIVPAGAALGDTLIAVLRCRSDRSFSTPDGWTLVLKVTPEAEIYPLSTKTNLYVLRKIYAGEPSLSFTQNVSAAAIASVAVVRGSFGDHVSIAGPTATISPVNPSSMLLAIGTTTGSSISAAIWDAPFTSRTSVKWSSSSPFFYGTTISTFTPGSLASSTASYTWASGTEGANYSVLIEIIPLS